jgi:transcriptional regulator with XRE-family HTH domain
MIQMPQPKLLNSAVSESNTTVSDQQIAIGRRIRRRRLLIQLTQAALAKSLGVSYQQIQKYEKGIDKPSDGRLKALAHLLGVQPEYFHSDDTVQADQLERFLEGSEATAVHRAIAGLSDETVRHRLIGAILMFCDEQDRSGYANRGTFVAWIKKGARSIHDAESVAKSIHELKRELAATIGKAVKSRKLSQAFVAELLGADQARISVLARGNVQGISLERLFRYLVLLGWSARIDISERRITEKGNIEIVIH